MAAGTRVMKNIRGRESQGCTLIFEFRLSFRFLLGKIIGSKEKESKASDGNRCRRRRQGTGEEESEREKRERVSIKLRERELGVGSFDRDGSWVGSVPSRVPGLG